MRPLLPFSKWLYLESDGIVAEPRGGCMCSGVYVGPFGRDRWFPGCGLTPNRHKSALVDVVAGIAHLIQKLHEPLQFRLWQVLDVRSQVLVTEKLKELLLKVCAGGVEPFKPSLNIGNWRRHRPVPGTRALEWSVREDAP